MNLRPGKARPGPESGHPAPRRLWRWWGRRPAPGPAGEAESRQDPLLPAGIRLRQAREARGLTLRQLADETRISTPVLEALERGWRDRLPEVTYLRTMLPLIERHLALPPGSLDAALPAPSSEVQPSSRRLLLQRFTPGSIDVFTTWQGTVLYGVLTLGLVYAVNLQQDKLAAQGLLSTRPVPPLGRSEQVRPEDPATVLLSLHPELRPLRQASSGQGMLQLRRERQQKPAEGLGVLELQFSAPARLELSGAGGLRTELAGASGSVALPVLPPFELRIEPPQAAAAVRWNGTALAPPAGGPPGRYRYPAPAAAPVPAPAAAPPQP
ncbi:MAG: helix-turn-helix domain-containing protein [Synechococcus sp.]